MSTHQNVPLNTSDNESTSLAVIDYEGLGLRPERDAQEILQVAAIIQPHDPATVADFGQAVSMHAAGYSDGLLDQVRNSDLDETGAKLSQVVQVARSLNVGPLSDNRSRLPVIGPLIDRFRLRAQNVRGKFDSTRQQIESLLAEVDTTSGNIRARTSALDEMFTAVSEEHRVLGIHVAAGRLRLSQLRTEADAIRGTVGNNPARLQELADLDAMNAALDKRIGDLQALQHSAMQALPMIRMIQASNRMLVDKFHTIRAITVPAWKREFMLSLTLNEQKNAVQLANTIDDTTNDLLKRNADLLHRNSVETARANQRLVIDVDTLKSVQQTLIKTVEDVLRIQHDGAQQRQQAAKEIEAMRVGLRSTLGRKPVSASTAQISSEKI